jgi:hypothetical protein
LEDPGLNGKLKIELVVFGEGVEIFKKLNHYDTLLLALIIKAYFLRKVKTP